ncbi:MAG: hypothetical protein Q8N96_00520 [Methylovulum sp.]|nr:hypothetical protein [Methylovulum sp.]
MINAEHILTQLHMSKENVLNEISLLLGKQQLAQYRMEQDYFEKKYQQSFAEYNAAFQAQTASYEMENDWLSWKFAVESLAYWQKLLS